LTNIDRFPKKPCKHCRLMGHFSYQCFTNPRKALKRTPINKIGKTTKQWYVTRATWIKKNPPPIDGTYWICYLKIHPWCPVRLDIKHLTLDHVVSRSHDSSLRFKQDNLRPACIYCNGEKGSRSLDQVKPGIV
jgi:5-methylcytosine-specific restriction endonuclease McrA